MGKYRYNRYRDLEIDISRLTFTDQQSFLNVVSEEFDRWALKLNHSRDRFKALMWLNVPRAYSRVVPWLNESSFEVHHANNRRFIFVRPHPASRGRSHIPSYGTHYVKVECVVIEEGSGRILMVRERIGTDSAFKNVSGSVEVGEFFADAAIREVMEEARIQCRFICLIGCGNRTQTRFDRDEIIMGCLLFAPAGQRPRADGSEVSDAEWFDPKAAFDICTPMTKVWIEGANACHIGYNVRTHINDIYRGPPHTMDFYVPRFEI